MTDYVTIANRMWEPVQIGDTLALGRADLHKVAAWLVSSGGYVLTPDVDQAAWDDWHAQNINHPAVRDGRLMALDQVPSQPIAPTPAPRKRRSA